MISIGAKEYFAGPFAPGWPISEERVEDGAWRYPAFLSLHVRARTRSHGYYLSAGKQLHSFLSCDVSWLFCFGGGLSEAHSIADSSARAHESSNSVLILSITLHLWLLYLLLSLGRKSVALCFPSLSSLNMLLHGFSSIT